MKNNLKDKSSALCKRFASWVKKADKTYLIIGGGTAVVALALAIAMIVEVANKPPEPRHEMDEK